MSPRVSLADAAALAQQVGGALYDKVKLAFLHQVALVARTEDLTDVTVMRRAESATSMLHLTGQFDLVFREHLWPAVMASLCIDESSSDEELLAACDGIIDSFTTTPPRGGNHDS